MNVNSSYEVFSFVSLTIKGNLSIEGRVTQRMDMRATDDIKLKYLVIHTPIYQLFLLILLNRLLFPSDIKAIIGGED